MSDYTELYNLSADELYEKANQLNRFKDCDQWVIYMIMAANKGHQKAIEEGYNFNTFMPNYTDKIKDFIKDSNQYEENIYSILIDLHRKINYDQNNLRTDPGIQNTYEKYANQNNTIALLELGLIYETKGDKAKSVELYQKGCDLGNHQGLYMLAELYKYKNNNDILANNYYKEAIKQGNVSAILKMARKYSDNGFLNNNMDSNPEKAKELFELGAEHNSIEAIKGLVSLYMKHYDKLHTNDDDLIKLFVKYKDVFTERPVNFMSQLCVAKTELEEEVKRLKQEVIDLKTHISLTPGGEEYLQVKEEWNKKMKSQTN